MIICYWKTQWLELNFNKTCVINDPLGQTHSLASSDHYFLLFCFARFEKWERTYGRITCAYNNDHYRPGLWVGRVDQYSFFNNFNFKTSKVVESLSKTYYLHFFVTFFLGSCLVLLVKIYMLKKAPRNERTINSHRGEVTQWASKSCLHNLKTIYKNLNVKQY